MTTVTLSAIEAEAPAARRAWPAWLPYVPLALILALQCLLSARSISTDPASADEGLYIYAGHQLIRELLHGGGSPYYETWLSGAPVMYAPIAAVADSVGGLAAVRLMSDVFQLVACLMLFLTGRRLFGYWAAICSCALWAGLSVTQIVGRNAIYDAMALMLLAVAAYCASRSREARWLLLVPIVLVTADFAKYIVLLFNPTIVLIAAYQIREQGAKLVVKRVVILGGTTLALWALVVFLAGTSYLEGIRFTTLERPPGTDALLGATTASDSLIVSDAYHWFGLIMVLAFASVAVAALFASERGKWWFLLSLAVTTFLVSLEAIHLRSDESTGRHDAFATWFGCIAAGYLLAFLVRRVPARLVRVLIAGMVVAGVLFSGYFYTFSKNTFNNHEGAGNTEVGQILPGQALLRPYLEAPSRFLLAGNDEYMTLYNDHLSPPWWNLVNDNYIKYPIPGRGGNWHGSIRGQVCLTMKPHCMYLEGMAGYRAAIESHAFSVVSITRMNLPDDRGILKITEQTAGYVLLTDETGPTFIYLPYYRHRLASKHRLPRSRAGST